MTAGATVRAVVALFSASTAFGQSETTQFYDVAGNTVAEVRVAINKQRPSDPDGVKGDAVTNGTIAWNFKSMPTQGACAISAQTVTLDMVVIMPRWLGESSAPLAVAQQWRRYLSGLHEHENGHKAILSQTAAAIRSGLAGVRAQNCQEVDRVATNLAKGLMEQSRARHRQYDAETEHGRTQGARFP